MKSLSMDLRERILASVLGGTESMPKIAKRFFGQLRCRLEAEVSMV